MRKIQSHECFHRSIPGLKQRIAGKSLPIEKFAVKKSARFFAQGETLTLSALELIYAWNGFKILAKKYENVEIMFSIIEREMKKMESIRREHCGIICFIMMFI